MIRDYIQTPPIACTLCGNTFKVGKIHLPFYEGNLKPCSVGTPVFGCFCPSCWDRAGGTGQCFDNLMKVDKPTDSLILLFSSWHENWLKGYDIDVNDISKGKRLVLDLGLWQFPTMITRGHSFQMITWGNPSQVGYEYYLPIEADIDHSREQLKVPCKLVIFVHGNGTKSIWDTEKSSFVEKI